MGSTEIYIITIMCKTRTSGSLVIKTSPSSAGAEVQFQVRELRSHLSLGPKPKIIKQKYCCNNSTKTLKVVHIQKKNFKNNNNARQKMMISAQRDEPN